VVARIESGVPIEDVLMLTFSRKAAGELRDRVTARLARTVREPIARTLHSYAFGVLRMAALRDPDRGTPRLLGGAEQDVVVRQMLAERDPLLWPEALRPALRTNGFAEELRDFIMRAKERGYDAALLRELGARLKREDWVSAAAFLDEYEGINALDPAKGFDQAALIRAAINVLLGDADLLAAERARRRRIYIDEYQDTDPAQADLIQLLADGADELILVGDPDQSIYAFRGADESAIAQVDERFGRGGEVPVVALGTCRRSGAELLAASRRIASRLPGRGEQRQLVSADGANPGRVSAALFRSTADEAAFVANELRRAGLGTGGQSPLAWEQMAVLVRSTEAIGTLRRALVTAGVPIALRREELPLAEQPVVSMLLGVLDYAVGRPLTEEFAEALLLGPVGSSDSLHLRRLRRVLRQLEPDVEPSLATAVCDVLGAQVLPEYVRGPVSRVAHMLAAAREAGQTGGNAEVILWAAWANSGLSRRWEQSSLRTDAVGAAANRDLDAVLQLFAEAGDFVDRLPGEAPTGFAEHLRAQQIPGDAFTRSGATGGGVSILTAHASKGLEWDLVCVAGVQEGVWPDLRRRGTLLGSEHLLDVSEGVETSDPSSTARQLAEERRLFYVAATRARSRLIVTAVSGEEEQPSRFLDELVPADGERLPTKLPRAAHLAGLVAHLRAVVCSPAESAEAREHAASMLAEMASAGVTGADPDEWWGLGELSTTASVAASDETVRVSPSRIESFLTCELRGLMEMFGVRDGDSSAASLGTVIHEIAAGATEDQSLADLQALLDEQLTSIDFGAPWLAANERERAHAMLGVLVEWLQGSRAELTHVGNELDFTVDLEGAVLSGQVDRLEKDSAGRLVVIDLKTGKSKPSAKDMPEHPQLGAYQLAIQHGAFREHGSEPGGAMLVQLAGSAKAAEQRQAPLDEAENPDWALDQVRQVVRAVRGSTFHATANGRCQICDVRTTCPLQDEGRQVTS
jgi:superfamily I DNA/RNA helicase/RecB family exonuclease